MTKVEIRHLLDKYGVENLHAIIVDNSRRYTLEFEEDKNLVRNFIDMDNEVVVQFRNLTAENFGVGKYGDYFITATPFSHIQTLDFAVTKEEADTMMTALTSGPAEVIELTRKKRF